MPPLANSKNDSFKHKGFRVIVLFFISFMILDFFIGLFLKNGLEKYYGLNTNAKIALIGHSHVMLGIDKIIMEKELGVPISKYTSEGVNVADRQVMIEHLLKKNSNIKTIIYGVDAWTFTGNGLSKNSHNLFYPFLGNSSIDSVIKNSVSVSDYWTRKWIKSTRYSEGLIASSVRGYLGNWNNFKEGQVNTDRLKAALAQGNYRNIENNQENIRTLITTVRNLQKAGIKVLLLYVPTIDLINQVEPQKFEETLALFRSIAKDYDNVEFINYLEPFSHDHKIFYDQIHLNPKGQKMITKKLVSRITNTNHLH